MNDDSNVHFLRPQKSEGSRVLSFDLNDRRCIKPIPDDWSDAAIYSEALELVSALYRALLKTVREAFEDGERIGMEESFIDAYEFVEEGLLSVVSTAERTLDSLVVPVGAA